MRWSFLLTNILLVCSLADAARGEAPQPGDLGIFFTDSPTSGADAVLAGLEANTPFDFFVLSFSVPGGMEAYEFGVSLPPGVIVSGGRVLPAGATDFGTGDNYWIVGTGGICRGQSGWFPLVRYAGVWFTRTPPGDTRICLTGGISFDPMPNWLVCDSPGNLQHFGAAYAGCALINPLVEPQPVPGRTASFGALKAGY